MSIKSPYRIGTDPSGKDTTGEFYMSSNQNYRIYNGVYGFHNGYDLIGLPFVSCTCGKKDHECMCNAEKVDGKYKHPQKMLYSTTPGTVDYVGWQNPSDKSEGFGLYVRIKSSISGQTHYYHYFGHLCEVSSDIKVGSTVKEGTFIGIEGSTGSSSGSHVHYEIRPNKNNPSSATNPTASPYYISLEYFTGIENKKNKTYKDTRRAGTITLESGATTHGVYLGDKIYSAYISNGSKWAETIPMIYSGSKWVNTLESDVQVDTNTNNAQPQIDINGNPCVFIPETLNDPSSKYHGYSIGTFIPYMGYHKITSPSSYQYKLREHARSNNRYKISPEYYATINGRIVIATKPNIGNLLKLQIGDYVDVIFQSTEGGAQLYKCIIGDFKGTDAKSIWGHVSDDPRYKIINVVEMIYHDYDPASKGYAKDSCKNNPWGYGRVVKIIKVGKYG